MARPSHPPRLDYSNYTLRRIPLLLPTFFCFYEQASEQAGTSGYTYDLYPRGTRSESLPGHQLFLLGRFSGFLISSVQVA
jgi:hypothetical protein